MKHFIWGILIGCLIFSCSPQNQPNTAEDILSKVEQNVQDARYVSFHTEYTSINLVEGDTTSVGEGTVWLKRQPSDSIFGNLFHVNTSWKSVNDRYKGGVHKSGEVDYYYDGQYSLEIHHKESNIDVFDPHKHPNTRNNPAKARIALDPIQTVVSEADLKKELLSNNPKVSIYRKNAALIIDLKYPESKHGVKSRKTLHIDPKTWKITQLEKRAKFRGVHSLSTYTFSSYNTDSSQVAKNIPLRKQYEDYSRTYPVKERQNNQSKEPAFVKLEGKQAPGFSYQTFDGQTLSLSDLKGQFVLLDFWESWCGACILAFPKMNGIYKKFKNDSLTVIGVTSENPKTVRTLIEENNLKYPNLKVDKQMIEDYKVRGRPAYVLIDPSGRVVETSYGDLDMVFASYPGKDEK